MTRPGQRDFADRGTLTEAVARELAVLIECAIARRGRACGLVPGGSTPGPILTRLAGLPLPWSRVTLGLGDERWVPAEHPDSNEGMLRAALAGRPGAAAQVIGLYRAGQTPEQAAAAGLPAGLASGLAPPFDAVMLGMGTDGHFASLFPQAPDLPAALSGDGAPLLAVLPPAAPSPRLSLTLAALLDTRALLLVATGADKRAVLQQAALPGPDHAPPLRALLRQQRTPLAVRWAP